MRLDIYGPNLPTAAAPNGATFAIHAAGCAHGRRSPLRGATVHTEDHASLTSVCDEYYPPEEFDCEPGEYLHDFYRAPCARALPDA